MRGSVCGSIPPKSVATVCAADAAEREASAMTTPTPDEICERLRNGGHCREAADLIQQQLAEIERLSAELNTEREWREDLQANVIEHSLKVERLSAALEYAKEHLHGTHEFAALAEIQAIALGKDASAPHIQKREKREE